MEVKVILGSNVTEIVFPREVREGPRGSPLRVRTKLGWVVTENLPGYVCNSESVYFVWVTLPEEELNELVKTWWKTEWFGCKYDSQEQGSREDENDMMLALYGRTQFVPCQVIESLLKSAWSCWRDDLKGTQVHRNYRE